MIFVPDTNFFIYSLDREEGDKCQIARRVVTRWLEARRSLPRQVLGEILSLGHRRGGDRLIQCRRLASRLATVADIVDTRRETTFAASDLAERYGLQYFDAVICLLAERSGADVLITEDMHDGLTIGNMLLMNPFASSNRERLDFLLKPAP